MAVWTKLCRALVRDEVDKFLHKYEGHTIPIFQKAMRQSYAGPMPLNYSLRIQYRPAYIEHAKYWSDQIGIKLYYLGFYDGVYEDLYFSKDDVYAVADAVITKICTVLEARDYPFLSWQHRTPFGSAFGVPMPTKLNPMS